MKKLILRLRNYFRDNEDREDHRTILETRQQTEMILKKLNMMDYDKLNKIMLALDIKEEFIISSGNMFEEAQKVYPGAHESSERAAFVKGVTWQFKRVNDERRN